MAQVDWFAVAAVINEVQKEVEALKAAVGPAEKSKAVGDLAQTFFSAVESFSGKEVVDNEKLAKLIADLVAVVADVDAL